MIKRSITYVDYNGKERTEDHWFHLNKAEIMRLEMSVKGGLTAAIHKYVANDDNTSIFQIIEEVILKSYGEKSPDGKKFIKNEEILNNFTQTEAYSSLLIELMSDDKKAADFMNAIVASAIGSN